MNRIVTFELAGIQYPLNFSVKAAKLIDEKYGSLDKLSGVFGWEDVTTSMYNVSWVLQLLMEQGAAYQRLMGEDAVDPLTTEELEVLIGAPDLIRAQSAILESIGLSMEQTVEVEPGKNEEATQVTGD